MSREMNFDGLVGPTHNYAGLSVGNLASGRNRSAESNPRAAALEGLAKMKRLADAGVPQAVLPPQRRPDLATLRRLGFAGSPQQVLDQAWKTAPDLFAACCSASAMWAANAATVAPSIDTLDQHVHFTPANLLSHFHRSIEADHTANRLRTIVGDSPSFIVHDPLPPVAAFADEGAANHLRLGAPDQPGLQVFVYGRDHHLPSPTRTFPARQTLQACQAIARLNALDSDRVLFVQQLPAAIDAGAFHNDVVAVSHHQHLLVHEQAFVDQPAVLDAFRRRLPQLPLKIHEVKARDIPLETAVNTYLFNSQIVSLPDGATLLVMPVECEENPDVRQYVQQQLVDSGFVDRAMVVDVRQSMRNGGGPACLRLRVILTDAEQVALQGRALLTDDRYRALVSHIQHTYPDRLTLEDLRDWSLCEQLQEAVEQVAVLVGLGASQ